MLSFASDYLEGAHPLILEALLKTNMEQCPGYGSDIYSERAKDKIRAAIGRPDADVWLLVGGTQTNRIVISALLRIFEGVVSVSTGHISTHECGAIEHAGHKVITLPEHAGKMDPDELCEYLSVFYADENHEASVFPGMVYVSHPTEYGTLYTKAELTRLHDICKSYGIPLYLDGARLGYGLCAADTDVTLADIAALTDVFYIGGTKVGALCGEAVVFTGVPAPTHFYSTVKQNGALLAKGRLLGVQFDTLFTDDLYLRISRRAIDRAMQLRDLFVSRGYPFLLESSTNQQFVILDNEKMRALREHVNFSFWEKVDDTHTAVRFATSWATTEEQIDALARLL